MVTAVKNQDVSQVKKLINANAKVDEQDTEGKTALMYAVQEPKNTEIVEELIKAKADIALKNNNGLNALMLASKTVRNTVENVKKLIAAVALVNERDNEGNTALIYAAQNGNGGVVRELIKNGADKKIINYDGKTALDLAAGENVKKILK